MIIVLRPVIEAYVFGNPPESWASNPVLLILYGIFWGLKYLITTRLGIFTILAVLFSISIVMLTAK
jgi:hypothetical protein